jgi:DNA-binding SARP family transcriptional activator
MAVLTLVLLGGFEARLGSGASVSVPTKKAQALLAYLGTRPGQDHFRDKLAALLWGESGDHQARDSLRHALVGLRKALDGSSPAALRVHGQILALDPAAVEVDVVTFEQHAAGGTPESLERAAEIYRGDLLLGFDLSEPLFEEWLVGERERLREMALEVLARLLAHQARAGGSTERAIRTAVRLLALDPLQEAAHRTLMRLYTRQGRRGAALKQYQLCLGVLQRELGTEPEPETKALYQELLRRALEPSEDAEGRDDRRERPARRTEVTAPDFSDGATPLFGRQEELTSLRQRLEKAVAGHGHVVSVVGEAGIGKTRLVGTLATEALARGCQVLIGRCHESDSVLPFGPWVDACRGAQLGADEEVLGALHPSRRAELSRLFPEAGIAGLPPTSDSALPLFEGVAQLIEMAAARRPMVLVLEDMHWADEMSLRLLAFVGRRVPAWPVLLIATGREEELADSALAQRTFEEVSRGPEATSLGLAPLARDDVASIVRALIRSGRDAPTLAHHEERIWAMSEGNPLVAVEAMLEAVREGRSAAAGEAEGALSLPERVRQLVGRRLDRLSARSQSVASVAAVIGRRFDFTLVRVASGVDEGAAAEAVEEMVRHRVLRAVGTELDFAHDRVRDVAYGRLLPVRRRLLHAAVAEALEGMNAGPALAKPGPGVDHPGERTEQLAYHALRGELWDKAVRYLREAGDRAAARSALQSARTWFEQALDAFGALPETRATLEQAFEISLALRPVLVQLGELRRVLELLREAESLAQRLNDDGRRGQVCAFMTNIHSRLDEPGEALVSGTRALEIAGRLGDLRLRILATTYLAQAHFCRGEYLRVIELATENLAALPAHWLYEFFGGSQPPSVNDRFRLLVSLAHLGRFAEAAEHEAEAIRLAEQTQHPYAVGVAYYAAGTLALIKGEWARARGLIERQIGVLRGGNIVGELPTALAYSARALAHLGDRAEALARCREAERLLERQPARGRVGVGWTYYSLGRACVLLGRLEDARRLATEAVASGSDRTDFVPDALHLLGDVAAGSHRFDADRAVACYSEALGLAAERRMRPLVAHCHLGLGTLSRRTGDGRGREYLSRALETYRELGMAFWQEHVETELRSSI